MGRKYEAIIEHNGDEKYIVAHVGRGAKKRAVLVSFPLPYHSDILHTYKDRLNEESNTVQVQGGGILAINKKSKKIQTYGKSGGLGRPDRALVETILKTNFPDYRIDAQVTDYVRG